MQTFGPFRFGSLTVTFTVHALPGMEARVHCHIDGHDFKDAIETMSADELMQFTTQAKIAASAAESLQRKADRKHSRRPEQKLQGTGEQQCLS